jgi:hypothetical protein
MANAVSLWADWDHDNTFNLFYAETPQRLTIRPFDFDFGSQKAFDAKTQGDCIEPVADRPVKGEPIQGVSSTEELLDAVSFRVSASQSL